MKKITTLIAIAITLLTLGAKAQTHIAKDAKGNYVMTRDTAVNKATGQTITDKDGKTYPVYISTHGKLYWLRTSKTGSVYKSYIKE